MYQSEIILNMNSRLFLNALEGVTDDQAKERISDHNNPLNWLATHTVCSRFMICMLLGKPAAKNPYEGIFENFKAFDPATSYPTMEGIKKEWATATTLLEAALSLVNEEHLATDSPLKSPIGDFTIAGTIAFLAQHESYDIGQMGF